MTTTEEQSTLLQHTPALHDTVPTRILVVDDSALMRSMLVRLLQRVGYTDVLTAGSGQETFEILGVADDSNPQEIDLVLLDLVLPDLDGIAVIQQLQTCQQLRQVPVIMITAMQDPDKLRSAFDAGVTDYITKPINEVELLARVGSVLRLKREIDRREAREQELLVVRQRLEQANERLQQLSLTDPLTTLANRRSFDHAIAVEWSRGLRQQAQLCLLLLDIDFFKQYNDTYGHQAGDQCLIRVAQVLEGIAQRATDMAARYGGEEFALLLPGTNTRGGYIVAERLLELLQQQAIPHRSSPISPVITMSIGVAACIPNGYQSPDVLIAQADEALYTAKRTGRSRVSVYEPGSSTTAAPAW